MAYKDIGRQTGYFRTGWKLEKLYELVDDLRTADRILQNGMETDMSFTLDTSQLGTADRILQNGMETGLSLLIFRTFFLDGRPDTSERDGNFLHCARFLFYKGTADRILQNGMETGIVPLLDLPRTADGRPDTSERDGNNKKLSMVSGVFVDGRPDTSERDGNQSQK